MNLRSMTDVEKHACPKHFVEIWTGKGYEKDESQKFWLSLLTDVMGVEYASEVMLPIGYLNKRKLTGPISLWSRCGASPEPVEDFDRQVQS